MGIFKKEIKVKSAVPFYLTGATWLIYALFFKLYRLTDFVIVGCVSVIVYLLSRAMIPDKTITVEDVEKTGDKIADEVIENGLKMLKELSALRGQIDSENLRKNVDEILETGEKIFEYLAKNPTQADLVRRFNNYYFPETLKHLKTHIEFSQIDSDGETAIETKKKIENAISNMTDLFKKQLDKLMSDKAFDVRTDIKVLQTYLAEEGLDYDELPKE